MATNDIASEKFLIFLVSCIACSVSLLLLWVILGSWLILGNSKINWSMSTVLLSLIFNLIILGASRTFLVLGITQSIKTQILVNFFVIFIAVCFFSTYVPLLGFKIIHVWIGPIIALVVVACQYFTYIAALKILSKDF